MLKSSKRLFALLLCFAVICGTFFSVVDVNAITKSELDKKIQNAQQKLNQNKFKTNKINSEVNSLNKKIDAANKDIDLLEKDISAAQKKYQDATEKLQEKKSKLDISNQGLKDRLKNMYMSGNVSFIDLMLSSDDVSEVLYNYKAVKFVYENDKKIVLDLKTAYEDIEKEQKLVKDMAASLEKKQDALNSAIDKYSDSKDALNVSKEKLSKENQKLLDSMTAMRRQSDIIKSQINSSSSSTSADAVKPSAGGFVHPVPGHRTVSSYYGPRSFMLNGRPYSDFHTGIDFPAPKGTPVVAAKDGRILERISYAQYAGNYIIVDHGGGFSTVYAHLNGFNCSKGQMVKAGQVIGYVGSTGMSTGPHLHFEIRINGSTVNPSSYL
ncbi:MAG: peptidoglycan DD-metalloendopeptidase family protein [Eubacteriales bacterium]|nr:peptidoglycan DD-metalloendopeptidase family protein [Eubacteriales bacterium]MDY3333033.1 peptidoglycan DD-metalloendopeptidase family protein [Gallibacter sp.]